MADIKIEVLNAVYMKITTERGIEMELHDYFAFRAKNWQFHPKVKAKIWDGFIRLYNLKDKTMYFGLLHLLEEFCEERGYDIEYGKFVRYGEEVDDNYVVELAESLDCPLIPHDYQIKYIKDAIRDGRSLNLSPTSSGKSLLQYLIARYYIKAHDTRVLIVVPRTQLTVQMRNDFVEYNCDPSMVGMMGDGVKTDPQTKIVVTTWHTLIKMPQSFFDTFGTILGDEAHNFESKTLTDIMHKLPECYFRHGFTGTISTESKVHRLTLEGLFGRVRKYISTTEMIDKGVAADFKIKAIVLNYPPEDKKVYRKIIKTVADEAKTKKKKGNVKYPAEKTFIKEHEGRNIFIRNLVWSLKDQNNLILFDDVESHGKILAELLEKEGRQVFFIHGGISVKERERIKKLIETNPEKIYDIVASSGTMSTGVSIKRLDNAIFASGTKGEVKTLQSIGRLLRKGNGSDDTTLYDIGDRLTNNDDNPNYAYDHFLRRIDIYNNEEFDYKIYKVDL